MINITEHIINKQVTSIQHNYLDRSLKILFNDETAIHFLNCAVVFDLGVTGHVISFVSHTGTLGMTLTLKELKENPEDYNFVILSRDIEDIKNKHELIISYKEVRINSGSETV